MMVYQLRYAVSTKIRISFLLPEALENKGFRAFCMIELLPSASSRRLSAAIFGSFHSFRGMQSLTIAKKHPTEAGCSNSDQKQPSRRWNGSFVPFHMLFQYPFTVIHSCICSFKYLTVAVIFSISECGKTAGNNCRSIAQVHFCLFFKGLQK